MYIYFVILAFAMAGALFLPQKTSKSTIYLACWMIALALFVGCSDMLGGYDRYIYGELFDEVTLGEKGEVFLPHTYSSNIPQNWVMYISMSYYHILLQTAISSFL